MSFFLVRFLVVVSFGVSCDSPSANGDHLRQLQTTAIVEGRHPVLHWGWKPDNYLQWSTHSNRLIPVYTYGTKNGGVGVDLRTYTGANSCYRNAEKLKAIYHRLPKNTVIDSADYMDQTDVFRLQMAAAAAGKKYIFVVVFDGMDWQTTWATSIHNLQHIEYVKGRGRGTHFQEYLADATSQYGWMVTSPFSSGADVNVDVDHQILNPSGKSPRFGGYNSRLGGLHPWDVPTDEVYLSGSQDTPSHPHPYTDSAAAATSITTGAKTYNGSINIGPRGEQLETIAHFLQNRGWSVGAVTSVPISHSTSAAAYAHNVGRNDYQDLARDLLGLPSISHHEPLSGMDVIVGGGFGSERETDNGQGENFVPGNAYLAQEDLDRADQVHGGKYVVAKRTAGRDGSEVLREAARTAAATRQRLIGFFGVGSNHGHLPFQTANGDFQTAPGRNKTSESYTPADLLENPTLAEMTEAALLVLQRRDRPFWLMMESGDVDWASHDNNIDNAIGAVNSGDAAIRVITQWVEVNSSWDDALLIVTADHGHYLQIEQPAGLVAPQPANNRESTLPAGDVAGRDTVAIPEATQQ